MNSSIIENINFWDVIVCTDGIIEYVNMKLRTKLDQISSEIYEYQLNEDSKEGAVSTAGYVAKTLQLGQVVFNARKSFNWMMRTTNMIVVSTCSCFHLEN